MDAPIKVISYERKTKDWRVDVNGEVIGWRSTALQAEALANEVVFQMLSRAGAADPATLTDEEAVEVLAAEQAAAVTAELVEVERLAGVDEAQPAPVAAGETLIERLARAAAGPVSAEAAEILSWADGAGADAVEAAELAADVFDPAEHQRQRKSVRAHTTPARAPRGRSQGEITRDALRVAIDSMHRDWLKAVADRDQVKADQIEENQAKARARFRRLSGLAA